MKLVDSYQSDTAHSSISPSIQGEQLPRRRNVAHTRAGIYSNEYDQCACRMEVTLRGICNAALEQKVVRCVGTVARPQSEEWAAAHRPPVLNTWYCFTNIRELKESEVRMTRHAVHKVMDCICGLCWVATESIQIDILQNNASLSVRYHVDDF
jgi:hypothetical protein